MKQVTTILLYTSILLVPIGFILRIQGILGGNLLFVVGLFGICIYCIAKTIKDSVNKKRTAINMTMQLLIVCMSVILFAKYLYWEFGDYPGLVIIPVFITVALLYLTALKTKEKQVTVISVLYLLMCIPLFGFKFYKSPVQYIPRSWAAAEITAEDVKKDVLINNTPTNFNNRECDKLYHEAIALSENGNYAAANINLSKCNDLEPGNPAVLNALGVSWNVIGNDDKALSCFYNAIRADSLQPEAYASAGYVLTKKGIYAAAISILKTGFDKSTEDQFTHFNIAHNLSVAYDDIGDCKSAKKYLEIAKNNGFNNVQFDEKLKLYEQDLIKECDQNLH